MTGKIQNAGNQKLVPQFYYEPFMQSWPAQHLVLSDEMRRCVDRVLSPHPDMPKIHIWPKHQFDEAGMVLYELREALRPATGPELLAWLWPIAGSVGNQPTESDFKRRVAGLELGAASIPHVGFNPYTQRLALSTFVLFPSVAEIVALVSADVAPLLERVRALKVIAGVSDPHYMLD